MSTNADSKALVEFLRYVGKHQICYDCVYAGECESERCLFNASSDAIKKLVKICNSLLSKYGEEAEAMIYEYSVHIDKDLDELHKEIEDYKAQINGVAEPPKEET